MSPSLTDKLVGFLVRPVETFRAARDESLTDAGIYYFVLLVISAVLHAVIAFLGISAADTSSTGFNLGMSGSVGAFVGALIIAFIGGIIGLLLWSVFLHVGAKVAGGRGDFADSFKSAVYSQTPNLLLGWIPVIGFLFGLWSLVLLFLGVRELHEVDTTKAIIAVVVALVLFLIVVAIFAFLGIAFLTGIAGMASVPGVTAPVA